MKTETGAHCQQSVHESMRRRWNTSALVGWLAPWTLSRSSAWANALERLGLMTAVSHGRYHATALELMYELASFYRFQLC